MGKDPGDFAPKERPVQGRALRMLPVSSMVRRAMKAGLVGYSQTGKTTLFNALTGQQAQTGGAGRGGKPNLGAVKVPDVRIDALSAIYTPKKTTYAECVFVDVPGPRTKGSGLDSATLQALQETDALVLVLRGFDALDGTKSDPVRELSDFEAELILNDLGNVERRLERLKKQPGATPQEKAVLEKCLAVLNDGRALRSLSLDAAEENAVSSLSFLSRRPLLVVLNRSEADASAAVPTELLAAAKARAIDAIGVCATLEAEIASLPKDEQKEFLAGMGIDEPASARVIRGAYTLLDYISFLTAGEDEVRAWPVRRGSTAPKAAGKVHSDIERGFIRAEVMTFAEFAEVKSEAKMKELGKLRVEGKDYLIADGDIVNFRFNV
jgi:ribosome-binding ATPase